MAGALDVSMPPVRFANTMSAGPGGSRLKSATWNLMVSGNV